MQVHGKNGFAGVGARSRAMLRMLAHSSPPRRLATAHTASAPKSRDYSALAPSGGVQAARPAEVKAAALGDRVSSIPAVAGAVIARR